MLPLLSGQPGLAVEVTGERADYREASDSLQIEVSTGEVAGESDWFDLGVTITVGAENVPFAALFIALSRGDSHLLLENDAYFSLDKPELQALGAADRGGADAGGLARQPAADQPVPGGPVGRTGLAGTRSPAGCGVAAAGRRPAVAEQRRSR